MFQSARVARLTHLLALQWWCMCNLRFDHRTLFEALCVWLSTIDRCDWKIRTCCTRSFLASNAKLETNFVQGHPIVHGDGQAYVWSLESPSNGGRNFRQRMRRRSHHLWRKQRLKPSSSDRCKMQLYKDGLWWYDGMSKSLRIRQPALWSIHLFKKPWFPWVVKAIFMNTILYIIPHHKMQFLQKPWILDTPNPSHNIDTSRRLQRSKRGVPSGLRPCETAQCSLPTRQPKALPRESRPSSLNVEKFLRTQRKLQNHA